MPPTTSTGNAALVGPTASGKSAIAVALAVADPGWEIVCVDSMQVYRGMDIGTAKATITERAAVPHHVVDVADPWEDYDVARYQADARGAIAEIAGRGHRALLVGGTALYLRAVVDDLTIPGRYPDVRAELDAEPDTESLHRRLTALDALAASRMEPSNRRRIVRALEVTVGSGRPFSDFGPGLDEHPPSDMTLLALGRERADLDRRIATRYETQMAAGFLDEVDRLVHGSRPWSRSASQALGYKELAAHLHGDASLDEAVDLAMRRTRRFARRQERWLRRDPRLRWVDAGSGPTESVVDQVRRLLDGAAQ